MESRNLILAIILSVGVLFIWSFFFESPEQEVLNGDIINGDVSEVNSNELDMESIDEIEKAEKYGSGSVAVHNSRHIGMLAYHSMMPLEHDMIGLTMTAGNSLSSVPTHGAEKRFATNPWAYAIPADKEPPFVFDIATTQVAGNKLGLAKRVGAKMDPAWITDSSGNPVLDEVDLPDNREEYMMLPFGGTRENGSHKGYGYAAVAEVFCDILSGMGAGFLMPPNTYGEMGHFVQAIKIDGFIDASKFKKDMDDFLRGLAETPPVKGQDRVVYAGLPEYEETQVRLKNGIPYHFKVIAVSYTHLRAHETGRTLGCRHRL